MSDHSGYGAFRKSDVLVEQLEKRSNVLRTTIMRLTGTSFSASLTPRHPEPGWPDEAKRALVEFWQLDAKISRRNSQRCVTQLRAFLTTRGEEDSKLADEATLWWLRRY